METSLLRIETLTSPPITTPEAQIYVRSQVVQLMFPAFNGGLIWNRPVAVAVRNLNGQEKIVPVLDITRIVLFTLAGLSFTSIFIFLFLRRRMPKS